MKLQYRRIQQKVTYIVWWTIFFGLILITLIWYPSNISISNPTRYNWYPDAVKTIDNMNVNREGIHVFVAIQISKIKELQRYVNLYYDETVKENTNILISNLATGIKQANQEIADLYIASEQLPSAFDQAYASIEKKAKDIGRLEQASGLLKAVKELKEKDEHLRRTVSILMTNQKTLLPILKEQISAMRTYVHQGCLLDLHHMANEHLNITMEIDGNLYNVEIATKSIITIIEDDNSNGMKKIIEELKSQTVEDQFKAKVYGGLSAAGGVFGSAGLGMIALKSGYAIVTITATAIAAPAAATMGAIGALAMGAHYAFQNREKYVDAALYQTELDILEAQRGNFFVKMKNLQETVNQQQTASKNAQDALNRIAARSTSFSKNIAGYELPAEIRSALSNELLHIQQQYSIMSSTFEQFKPYTTDKNQRRIAG